MGSAVSISDKFAVNKDEVASEESHSSTEDPSSTSSSLSLQTPSTFDVLSVMRQSRFYQNYDTNEIILILASDNIEHIPNIDRSEWHEVQLSAQQEAYLSRSQQLPNFQKGPVSSNQTSNGTSHKVDLKDSSLVSNSKPLSPTRTTKSNKPLLPLVPLLRSLVLQI